MNAFLTAFAATTGLTDSEADEQWAAYSRQLSDVERARIEAGGTRSGVFLGGKFLADYPPEDEQ